MDREDRFVHGRVFAALAIVTIGAAAWAVAYFAPKMSIPAWAVVAYIVASAIAAVALPIDSLDPYNRRCTRCGRHPEPPALVLMIMTPIVAGTVFGVAALVIGILIVAIGMVGMTLDQWQR